MNSVRGLGVYAYRCYQETMWTVQLSWSGNYGRLFCQAGLKSKRSGFGLDVRRNPERCSSAAKKDREKTKEGELATAADITKDVCNSSSSISGSRKPLAQPELSTPLPQHIAPAWILPCPGLRWIWPLRIYFQSCLLHVGCLLKTASFV